MISVGDIVSLVEQKVNEIDWEKIESVYPQLFKALPIIHYITPWNERVLEKIPFTKRVAPSGVGERFKGWPQLRLAEQRGKGVMTILRHTFFPGQWWLMIYYSPSGWLSTIWCRFVRHPTHIFWWMRLYWNIFLEANLSPGGNDPGEKKAIVTVVKNIKILIVAMYRKFK